MSVPTRAIRHCSANFGKVQATPVHAPRADGHPEPSCLRGTSLVRHPRRPPSPLPSAIPAAKVQLPPSFTGGDLPRRKNRPRTDRSNILVAMTLRQLQQAPLGHTGNNVTRTLSESRHTIRTRVSLHSDPRAPQTDKRAGGALLSAQPSNVMQRPTPISSLDPPLGPCLSRSCRQTTEASNGVTGLGR